MPVGHTHKHTHICIGHIYIFVYVLIDECFSSAIKYYCTVCAGWLGDDNIYK
jgi:hypothetical protein